MSSDEINVNFRGPACREQARLSALLCVEIPVTDVPRAVDFYVNKLGLFIDLERNPNPFRNVWGLSFLKMRDSRMRIVLVKADRGGLHYSVKQKPHAFVMLQLAPGVSIYSVWLSLHGRGVNVGEMEGYEASGRAFNVYDPDENLLRLSDWRGAL